MMFPDLDMLGVDYIIPDWGYLRDKKDLLRAIFITHGHQDHIGALSHFLQEFDVPVYATPLTRGLIEVKLKRDHMLGQTTLHTYSPGDVIEIDIPARTLNVQLTEEELAERAKRWTPREARHKTGYLAKYASMATSADTGAILKW